MVPAPLLALAIAASSLAVVGEADVSPPAARRTPAEARLLRARAALSTGDAAAAERELEGLEALLPAIPDRIDAMRATAAEAQGDGGRAVLAWERVPPGSVLYPQARVSMGRLLHAAGKPTEAVAALQPLLAIQAPGDLSRADPAPRALLLAGKILAEQPGGGPEARRLFLECWAGHALAAEAKECRSRLDALPAPDGAPPGDEDGVRRAEALLDWNRNELALSEARKLGDRLPPVGPDAGLSCRAAFVRGKAQRKLRQHADAAAELGPVVESCTDPTLRPRALYLLSVARSNVTNVEGIEAYRRFAREYPEHSQSDDALYFASDLLVRQGRIDEALAL